MSVVGDFFSRLFNGNNKTKRLGKAKLEIPDDYESINRKIESGELVLEEIEESELLKIEEIFNKKLEQEKNEISELLEEYKELKRLNDKG